MQPHFLRHSIFLPRPIAIQGRPCLQFVHEMKLLGKGNLSSQCIADDSVGKKFQGPI